MAEDFLETIYQDAKLISEMRQIACYAQVHDEYHVRRKYMEQVPELIRVCKRYVQSDKAGGEEFFRYLQEIHDVCHDLILMGDIIEHKLLPLLEKSMEYYGRIQTENEEGDFLFQTTASGFLTIKDLKHDLYIHSTVDPMWEAEKVAEYIFDPRKKEYSILGCGLGYLIYQLYVISNGTVLIRVFEKDARMVEYARKYGVLDWVPADRIKITVDADPLPFLESVTEETKCHVLVPELASEPDGIREILMEFYVNYSSGRKLKRYYEINYWNNLRSGCKMVSEFDAANMKREMVIVAAGPSLDDNLEFLRENSGKKTIIAVGTVFKKLLEQKIYPDMVVIVDPQEQTYQQVAGLEEQKVPMLLGMTAYWKIAAAYQGEKYLIPSKYLKELDNITEEYEDEWNDGGTVTYSALEAAVRFKAEKIFFVGADLSYPGGMTHATGTLQRTQKPIEKLIPIEGCGGTTVYSDTVLISYLHAIENMIERTPWISYYNTSHIGAKIAGTKTLESD
ncbi:MAG: DUF115 domain-containing protein [Lachnospiraceae bacterium]|nr:DUF115 domain-containing protein [Lachnospiraceae bacterium]